MTTNQPCFCSNCGKRLFAWLMAQNSSAYEKIVKERKQSLFANLQGNVLEIGPGTGPNLSYYPKNINWIGIEPNPFMHRYLHQEAQKLGFKNIDLRTGTSQQIDAEDNSMDAVVSTLVLCSVPSLATTLQEIVRVLKPGGRFLFIEHVAAQQGTWLRKVQNVIRPVWQVLGDGCHPNRETWVVLEKAGFSSLDYQHFDAYVPVCSPHIIGVAMK